MHVINGEARERDLGGGVTRKVLSYGQQLMSVELKFKKGAIGEAHCHPHVQIGYIVSGSLRYKEGDEENQILKSGDTYYVEPNMMHGIEALEDTVLLDIFTPMRTDFL